MSLNISLDYDGTYTADPLLWNNFIDHCDHNIYIVTLRSEDKDKIIDDGLMEYCTIIYCDGQSKRMVTEALGIHIDIWIDDMPECISQGSNLNQEQLELWRQEKK